MLLPAAGVGVSWRPLIGCQFIHFLGEREFYPNNLEILKVL